MMPSPGRDRKAVRHPAPTGRPTLHESDRRPRVAVIGGGVAGLAAATGLAERGVEVHLLEREPWLGGRVAGWSTTLRDASEARMNRGFHAFFRQYYNLRALLRRVDPPLDGLVPVDDYPLLHRNGHRDTFAGLPRTPPWNALAFVARSPTFAWHDLTRLSPRAALPLARVTVPDIYHQLDHRDAASFLDDLGFPRAAKELAFRVFSRSFFAAPAELSAAELAVMFHLYFLGSSEGLIFDVAADCFPLVLWNPLQHHLLRLGVHVRTGHTTRSLQPGGNRRFAIEFAQGPPLHADAVVLAAGPAGLRELVAASPDLADSAWRQRIARLRSAPPFLVSRLWLDRPVAANRPAFVGTSGFGPVDNISVLERYERSAREWCHRTGGSVVELHSYALADEPSVAELRPHVLAALHEVYPETVGASVLDERHELHADCPLFPPHGFADRPGVTTPDPYLVLAGDLVRIDLPVALMERAATTGLHAANTLLARWGLRGHDLWSVPDRGRLAPLRRLASTYGQSSVQSG